MPVCTQTGASGMAHSQRGQCSPVHTALSARLRSAQATRPEWLLPLAMPAGAIAWFPRPGLACQESLHTESASSRRSDASQEEGAWPALPWHSRPSSPSGTLLSCSTNRASDLNAAGRSLTARERSAGETADDLACSAAAPQPCRPIRPKAVRAQPGALPLQALALQSWALPSHAAAAVATAAAAAASAEAHQAALAAHSAFYVPSAAAACEAPAAAGERQAAGSAEARGSAMSTLLEAIGVLGARTRIEVPLQREEAVQVASAA